MLRVQELNYCIITVVLYGSVFKCDNSFLFIKESFAIASSIRECIMSFITEFIDLFVISWSRVYIF